MIGLKCSLVMTSLWFYVTKRLKVKNTLMRPDFRSINARRQQRVFVALENLNILRHGVKSCF